MSAPIYDLWSVEDLREVSVLFKRCPGHFPAFVFQGLGNFNLMESANIDFVIKESLFLSCRDAKKLLSPGTILVGHSLDRDLTGTVTPASCHRLGVTGLLYENSEHIYHWMVLSWCLTEGCWCCENCPGLGLMGFRVMVLNRKKGKTTSDLH